VKRKPFVRIRALEISIVIFGMFFLSACEKKPSTPLEVVEDWDGDIYTLTVGRDSKIFDLSKVEDRMRLEKFKEKYREALEEHQREKELQAQELQEMHHEDVKVDNTGQGEGVLQSFP